MNRSKIEDYQMLTRVVDLGTKYVGLFSKTSVAAEVWQELETRVRELSGHASAQVSGEAAMRSGRNALFAARSGLSHMLAQAELTALALKCDKVRAPRKRTDQALIAYGNAFMTEIEPLKKEFSKRGLQSEDLSAAIQGLERARLDYSAGKALRSSSIHEFNKGLDEAIDCLRQLDALVGNTLADNPTAMASWAVARKVTRAPSRRSAGKPAAPSVVAPVPEAVPPPAAVAVEPAPAPIVPSPAAAA